MTVNPLSRYKAQVAPQMRPGHCLCRSVNGPFIDSGISIMGYGRVYLCSNCIMEMHRQLGLESVINKDEFDQARAASFADGLRTGEEQTLEAIRDFVDNRISSAAGGDAGPDESSSVEESDGNPEALGSNDDGDGSADVGSEQGADSVIQQGPDDLSDADGPRISLGL